MIYVPKIAHLFFENVFVLSVRAVKKIKKGKPILKNQVLKLVILNPCPEVTNSTMEKYFTVGPLMVREI